MPALAAMLSTAVSQAAVLTPEAALERALESASPAHRIKAKSPNAYKLTYNSGDVFVFTTAGSGYLAVPADDCAPAVLGYSTSGSVDAASMPPAMKWWLGEYGRQLRAAGASATAARGASVERAKIWPMLTSEWNQSAPFNDMCPEIDGKRAVTGCVATALAQVMRYHQWPEHGTGRNAYTSGGSDVSLDFSSVTFDWADMADTYAAASADAVANGAVAQLMFACGVAVDMQYGTSESGASVFAVAKAMSEYFGYDAAVRYVSRDYYGLEEWEDYVYSQLRDYGPVQYSGQSNDGAHSFVCDGYDADGYFHINWGWGGMSDGYFLLAALDPEQQGVGGSTSGYNFDQSVIACVSKPKPGSVPYINMLMEGTFAASPSSVALGEQLLVEGETFNFSTVDVSGTPGLKLVDESGATVYAPGAAVSDLRPLSGIGSYYVTLPSELAEGTYTATPAFYTSYGQWQDIPVRISGPQSLTVTVANDVATISEAPAATVRAIDFRLLSELYEGQQMHLGAELVNEGNEEFYGAVAPVLVNSSGSVVAMGESYPVDLESGESAPFDYTGTFDRFDSTDKPASGSYTLYIIDANTYRPVSEGIEVTWNELAESPEIVIEDLGIENPEYIKADDVTFTAKVTCKSGYFGGTYTVAVFPYSTESVTSVASFTSAPVFLKAGESATVKASGAINGALPGERYMAAVFESSRQMTAPVVFTIGGLTGIDRLDYAVPAVYPAITDGPVSIVGAEITGAAVYNASGALVGQFGAGTVEIDLSPYAAGVYLVELRYGPDGGLCAVDRVVKR